MNVFYNSAFVDGSYNPYTKEYGCGVVFFNNVGHKEYAIANGDIPELIPMRNVAGEILGAITAIDMARKYKMDTLTIYHDYEGLSKWAIGEWKAKNEWTKFYKRYITNAINDIDIQFKHVRSHSGNSWNEKADKLAKMAVNLS